MNFFLNLSILLVFFSFSLLISSLLSLSLSLIIILLEYIVEPNRFSLVVAKVGELVKLLSSSSRASFLALALALALAKEFSNSSSLSISLTNFVVFNRVLEVFRATISTRSLILSILK